jgi:hypothetical protein
VPENSQGVGTRPPAVAGLFYPRDPARLQTEVLELLDQGAARSTVMPKALIAPHAGYTYSGPVAGAAFAILRASAQTITRVVLIGPAHYVHLSGIAVPTSRPSQLPLIVWQWNLQRNRLSDFRHPDRRAPACPRSRAAVPADNPVFLPSVATCGR